MAGGLAVRLGRLPGGPARGALAGRTDAARGAAWVEGGVSAGLARTELSHTKPRVRRYRAVEGRVPRAPVQQPLEHQRGARCLGGATARRRLWFSEVLEVKSGTRDSGHFLRGLALDRRAVCAWLWRPR